jgi:Fe-S oxidoreductase
VLTLLEKIVFISLSLVSLGATVVVFRRIVAIIRRGEEDIEWAGLPRRLLEALVKTLSQRTVLASRRTTSWFHAFVAWGFFYYFLVNLGDLLEGFIPEFHFLGQGVIGGFYRLGADLLSVAVLVGMVYLVIRRFVQNAPELKIREEILLHPKARGGIRRDSAIVAGFVLLHVGARFLGQSFQVAQDGTDLWQPIASLVAGVWTPLGQTPLVLAEHAAWWVALGLILAFLPYFPYSKHLHLMATPVNFLIKPERPSMGALSPMELDVEATRFGSDRLENLPWPRLFDTFACIMCNRCQDVCPAYAAGTVLSPSALEINKRYEITEQMVSLAAGAESRAPLLDSVITADAVWACTSCAACVEICPVGNEPMQDLIDIRRYLTLTEGDLPSQAAMTLRNIEMRGNPWGYSPDERSDWAADLDVPTMAEKGEAEVLFWVGCSGSFDPRTQKITLAVAQLLQRAGVDFAILGTEERCNGDPARRMGEEFGFQMAVEHNAEIFDKYRFRKVITACPHCFNTFRNEYVDFGVDLDVMHHSQFIAELIAQGRLEPNKELASTVTFHDSCYLGRYNREYDAPRAVLESIPGLELREMPRNRERGLCCGGGGGGIFQEVPAERDIADIRIDEAASVEPDIVASACPFCMTMFEGSQRKSEMNIETKDIAELLVDSCDT